ncbi:HAD family hydrolase [Caldalkalibacillus mannanilyticus]|uniref:HAD family hydrolase n=1 Tax=Caldalkalibacillus mannanilyticus TaxID=1418 RepID=UPI000469E46E|nr:HAD-IB family hydrolase [Caldalkalibacillus mannanilyticus]
MKVAIFDFDGTLFPEETFPLMMNHLKNHPVHNKRYKRFMVRALPVYAAYKCKLYPEQKMKGQLMQSYLSSFGDTSQHVIEEFFHEMGEGIRKNLSKAVLERQEQHKKEGYYTMLVSGAFEPLLHSVTKNLTFDSIIGTGIPFNQNKLDRRSKVIHIHGKRKTEKIYEQLGNRDIDWDNSFCYGDSYSDLDVLQLVGNPVAVNPDPRLLKIAQEQRWNVVN